MEIKMTTYQKQIKVVNKDCNVLFEGVTDQSKASLIEQYGSDIKVYYEKLFTTISPNQSYKEALEDTNQFNNKAYCLEEFNTWLATKVEDISKYFIVYSQNNLDIKEASKPKKKSSKVILTSTPKLGVYFYTNIDDIKNNIPISGLTKDQVEAARYSLTIEKEWLNNYAIEHNLSINSLEVKQQQLEAIAFITGTNEGINNYIRTCGVRWISFRGDSKVKGLIKTNNSFCNQVYLLIINVKDNKNINFLKQVGYINN